MIEVSVVIPVYNEEKYIGANIEALLNSEFPQDKLEIILVDGNSDDETSNMIKKYQRDNSRIRLFTNPKRYTPISVNIGVRAATGKYVIILGAHSVLDKQYILKLYEAIEKYKTEAVGGVIVTSLLNRNKVSVAISKVLSSSFGVGNATYRIEADSKEIREVETAGFLCYNRKKLLDMGIYNEKLIRNHDIELNKRIVNSGGKILLVPDAVVTYFARETYGALAGNNYKNGLWNIKTVYITRDFKSLSLRHFVPLLFLLSLIIPSLLALLWKPFGFVAISSFTAYNLAVLAQAIKLNDNETSIWSLVKGFYTIHFSYGWGSFVGIGSVLKDFILRR